MADSTDSDGAKVIPTKACVVCGATFSKPYTESKRGWAEHKYCSRKCINAGRTPWNKGTKQPRASRRIPCRICGGATPYSGTQANKLWGKVHCGTVECARASDQIKRDRISAALRGRNIGGKHGWMLTEIVTRQERALDPWFTKRGWISQYPVKPGMPWKFWRLDFAHPALMLNVEIDGSAHDKPARRTRDETRDARMKELGWRVLRVRAEDVDEDVEAVKRRVSEWIDGLRVAA